MTRSKLTGTQTMKFCSTCDRYQLTSRRVCRCGTKLTR